MRFKNQTKFKSLCKHKHLVRISDLLSDIRFHNQDELANLGILVIDQPNKQRKSTTL